MPAGGTVEVREVRFPGHALSDAWLLDFEDPAQPYTIRYRVSELGGAAGGELTPAPLLADGSRGVRRARCCRCCAPELATGHAATRAASPTPRGLPTAGASRRASPSRWSRCACRRRG